MQLSELAVLTAGIITSRVLIGERDQSSGNENADNGVYGKSIMVLIPKAIHDGKVDHFLLAEERQAREISEDFLTREGDIIMKFSSPYDSCLITKEDEGLLIPSFCCKIRIRDFEETSVDFLLAYLCSDICKEELKRKCFGNVIALTKKSDVMKINVPVFDKGRQEEIGARFRKVQRIRDRMEDYLKLEQERLDSVFGGDSDE